MAVSPVAVNPENRVVGIPFGWCGSAGSPEVTPLEPAPSLVHLGVVRFYVALIERNVLLVPGVCFAAATIEQENVMEASKMFAPLLGIIVRSLPFPHDFVDEIVFPEGLVEHHLDVVGGVPVAVIVEGAGGLKNTAQLDTAGAHEINVGLGALVAILKGPLLLGLAPEDLVVAVGVERRVNVNEIDAMLGQLLELLKAVAAIDHPRIDERGRPARRLGGGRVFLEPCRAAGDVRRIRVVFPTHGASIKARLASVNATRWDGFGRQSCALLYCSSIVPLLVLYWCWIVRFVLFLKWSPAATGAWPL